MPSLASDPATLQDALFDLSAHIQQLMLRDRQHELDPLLAALERVYVSGTPAQRGLMRDHVFATLRDDCEKAGVLPHLVLDKFGPQCRAAWAEVRRS